MKKCQKDSSMSISEISRTIGMSRITVHRVLKENQMYAFHSSKIHYCKIIYVENKLFYIDITAENS